MAEIPSKETRDVLDKLRYMEEKSKKHISTWGGIYEDGRNYVWANQLQNQVVKEGWEPIQVNHIFPAVIQEQSLLAQKRASIEALPFEDNDKDGAEFWRTQLQWQYETGLDVPSLLLRGILDGKTHGHWVVDVYWDPEAEWDEKEQNWVGAIKVVLRRPEQVCFDPDCEDVDEPEWAYQIEMMPVELAVEKWSDFEKEIREAVGAEAGETGKTGWFNKVMSHIMPRRKSWRSDKGDAPADNSEGRLAMALAPDSEQVPDSKEAVTEKVLVMTVLYKDPAREDDEVVYEYTGAELLEDGRAILGPEKEGEDPIYLDATTGKPFTGETWPSESRKVRRPKYPNGRLVVRIGETLVEDRPWEYKHWRWAVGHNGLLPHTWHGLNGVEMAKGIQDFLNVFARHLVNYVKFFGDPVMAVEAGAFANDPQNEHVVENTRAVAGSIYKLADAGKDKIQRFDPPPMSQGLLACYELFSREIRDQTGMQDIGMGKQQPGQTTAREALALDTNSKMRPALQGILLEMFILRLMRRVQELCQKNMTPGQMVRIAGDDAAGVLMKAVPEDALEARFDLRLKVTSELPFDQERRKMEAKELYALLGLPFISQLLEEYADIVGDQDELLEKIDAYRALVAAVEQKRAEGEQQNGEGTESPGA